jgi:putative MATE family efflux protein
MPASAPLPPGSAANAPASLPPSAPARFVTGSILRHILVMTGTSAVGLMAIFAGDFANILFLGSLRDGEVLAAAGYAGTLLFFVISAGVGMAIAVTALVSPALGARDLARARRLATHAIVVSAGATTLLVAGLCLVLAPILGGLGAGGRTLALARDYLLIVLPSLPLLTTAMAASAVLRSAGDAQRAMYITLVGAAVAVALDAVLILWIGLGIHGAAVSAFASHVSMLTVGWWSVVRVHGLLDRPQWHLLERDVPLIARFAVPAVLTQLATPAGGAVVTATIAQFGHGAVAGWTVIGRVIPIAFGAIFSLSASVGPIIGQNLGAREFGRVRAALKAGLGLAAAITATAWLVLALATPALVAIFHATGETAALIAFFCRWLAPLFVFFGTLFVCNAACNTLGRPHYATALNWGRATLGTVPFVMLGSSWGAEGVLLGHMAGGIAFGIAAVVVVNRLIARLEAG